MRKHRFLSIALLLIAILPLSAATMNPKVRSMNASLMEQVFAQPEEYLPSLVKALTTGASGISDRTKILHDWICDNIAYDTEIFEDGAVSIKQDYVSVLKKKKAICAGYTNLMNKMCDLAGIESIGIEGYSKGFGYSGHINPGQRPDHDWNAIKIGNRWQLVDVTWDAGFCDGKYFVKHYTTDYLYLTPEQFIFSHLPLVEDFQYLKTPITREDFVKQPYVPGKFFAHGLSFGKNMPYYSTEIDECTIFDLTIKDSNVVLDANLVSVANTRIVECSSWMDRTAGKVGVSFDVPDKGEYKARIMAKRKGENENPIFISASEWESVILPKVEGYLQQKSITQKEYELLLASYELYMENQRYYIREDLFDRTRISAVTKILKLAEKNTYNFEEILSFNIKASDKYAGYGISKLPLYPVTYIPYHECANTKLISPREGCLQKGSKQIFSIQSKDYVGFAFILKGRDWKFFTYNPKTACYELELDIPSDEDSLTLMATKDKRQYTGLMTYTLH